MVLLPNPAGLRATEVKPTQSVDTNKQVFFQNELLDDLAKHYVGNLHR